jgi:hypothetical protein
MFHKGKRIKHTAIAFCIVFGLLLLIGFAMAAVSDDSSTAAGASTVKPASTITLIATGAQADVTYNDGHHAVRTHGPFQITLPLQQGRNYTIGTLNIHAGDSSCTIKVGSKVVASRKALGQGNVAGCVVVENQITHTFTASTW